MKNLSVKELRQNKVKVEVKYSRYSNKDGHLAPLQVFKNARLQSDINSRGGRTEVRLTDIHGLDFTGVSLCHKNDPFVKKSGLIKALGRAYSNMLAGRFTKQSL